MNFITGLDIIAKRSVRPLTNRCRHNHIRIVYLLHVLEIVVWFGSRRKGKERKGKEGMNPKKKKGIKRSG